LRNDVFDARNFFDPAQIPPYRQNQFGATAGGPIHRDRTFAFLGYEGLRVRQSLTQRFSVPSLKVRKGDFSGLGTIYDPLTTDAGGRRQAFLSNMIDSKRLDPTAVAFLEKLPLPNLPGEAQNYIATPEFRNNYDQVTARVDHQFGHDDSFFGRL